MSHRVLANWFLALVLNLFNTVSAKDYASFCYACVSKYPSYSWVNESSIVDYLVSKNLHVGDGFEECNEKALNDEMPLQFKQLPAVFCPMGVCVKLKSVILHPTKKLKETFVVRHCWEKLIDDPYDMQIWYNCSEAKFLPEFETQMCSCHMDLCNHASTFRNYYSFFIFALIFFDYFDLIDLIFFQLKI